MNYHIWTIGCQMNTADSQRLASRLEGLGYSWTDTPDDADVVVLNTCVVRQQAEERIYGRLGSLKPLKEARPEMVIGLMGCLVGHKIPTSLRERFPTVDVFIPPSGGDRLVELLRSRAMESVVRDTERERIAARWQMQDTVQPGSITLPEHERGQIVTAHVPVIFGCSWVCTFCIIPSRRGPERSRPADDIVEHVRSLVEQGVREVTLLGQIVDRYGYDRGEHDGLPRLLRRLDGIDGLARIRFLTSHPNFMSDELLDAIATLPSVMEHIEVPFQAGDDEVLQRMKRGYSVDDYRRLVERIRTRIPGAAIHTDIIVGFCGETEEQFQGTYDLLAELELDKAHIAKFSTRPGTVAAKMMLDDVSDDEKERRRAALDELQESICERINARHLGQTVDVLVEGEDRGRWRSRTRTNKLVFFEDDRDLLGQTVPVEITWTGPWSMVGQAVDSAVPVTPERQVIELQAI